MDTKKPFAQNEQSISSTSYASINTALNGKSLYRLVSSNSNIIEDLGKWYTKAGWSILCNREDIQFTPSLRCKAYDIGERIVSKYGSRISGYDNHFSDTSLKYLETLFNKYSITSINDVHREYAHFIDYVNGVWFDRFKTMNPDKRKELRGKYYLNDNDFSVFVHFCLTALQDEQFMLNESAKADVNRSNSLNRAISKFSFYYKTIKSCDIKNDPEFIKHKVSFNKEMVSNPVRSMEFCIQYYLQCLQNKAMDETWIFIGRLINSRANNNE